MSAGRVSAPVKAALSGSHIKAPGFAGGYLLVNLKTAKALGITIPESILLRADEVVR